MNYFDAFNKLVNEHGLDVIKDNTLVHSFLSDYVGASFSESRLVEAYYLLNESSVVYDKIKKLKLDKAKEYIKDRIEKCSQEYSKVEYIKSIEPLLLILYPNEYVLLGSKPKQAKKNNNKSGSPLDISIDANDLYSTLDIEFDYVNSIKVLSGKDDITHKAVKKIPTGIEIKTNYVTTRSFSNSVKIYLPHKGIRNIVVQSKTIHKLKISTLYSLEENANSIKIDTCANKTTIVGVKCKSLRIVQEYGKIKVDAQVQNLNIRGKYPNVRCNLDHTLIKQVFIKVSGNIKLSFNGISVNPQVNRRFKTIHEVTGTYRVGGNDVALKLSSGFGKIKVA